MPDSFDMKTLFPSRTALHYQNQAFREFTNSEETGITVRETKQCAGRERMRERTANVSEVENSFQELFQPGTTLQRLSTPQGGIDILLRKDITSLFRLNHFTSFVVSRAHLGLAEVGSSVGASKEKLTSLEMVEVLQSQLFYKLQFWK